MKEKRLMAMKGILTVLFVCFCFPSQAIEPRRDTADRTPLAKELLNKDNSVPSRLDTIQENVSESTQKEEQIKERVKEMMRQFVEEDKSIIGHFPEESADIMSELEDGLLTSRVVDHFNIFQIPDGYYWGGYIGHSPNRAFPLSYVLDEWGVMVVKTENGLITGYAVLDYSGKRPIVTRSSQIYDTNQKNDDLPGLLNCQIRDCRDNIYDTKIIKVPVKGISRLRVRGKSEQNPLTARFIRAMLRQESHAESIFQCIMNENPNQCPDFFTPYYECAVNRTGTNCPEETLLQLQYIEEIYGMKKAHLR